MTEQLLLGLPVEAALDAENFLISDCNASAAALIGQWPDWPGRACIIAGPPGCGKSHLAAVWRQRSGAAILPAGAITAETEFTSPIAVEDVDRAPLDERAFFHLINSSREKGFDVLFTARTLPGTWTIALPDLRSRFRSLTVAQICEPDDELLRALLVKHFADRQLAIQPDIVTYILKRVDRSASALQDVAAAIDEAGFARQKGVTRSLVREVLMARYGAEQRDG